MTVSELIRELASCPQDKEVKISIRYVVKLSLGIKENHFRVKDQGRDFDIKQVCGLDDVLIYI